MELAKKMCTIEYTYNNQEEQLIHEQQMIDLGWDIWRRQTGVCGNIFNDSIFTLYQRVINTPG